MGVPFEERNISINSEYKQQFRDREYDLLPIIEVGNTIITDYTGEPMLIEVLVREGYL